MDCSLASLCCAVAWCRYKNLQTTIALDLDAKSGKFGPYPGANPHYLRISADSKKAFLSLANAGIVLYLDISDPEHVTIKNEYKLPDGSAPHYIGKWRNP